MITTQIIKSSSRSFNLPYYAQDGFKGRLIPMISKNVALSGRMYVDVQNVRSGWVITIPVLEASEYAILRALFDDQINNAEFLQFTDVDLGLADVRVWMSLPDERLIKWNKTAVTDLTITLEPRDADS